MGVATTPCQILRGAPLSSNFLTLLDPFCPAFLAVVLQQPRAEHGGGGVAGGQADGALAAGWGRVRGKTEPGGGSLGRAVIQRPPLLAGRSGKQEATAWHSLVPPSCTAPFPGTSHETLAAFCIPPICLETGCHPLPG